MTILKSNFNDTWFLRDLFPERIYQTVTTFSTIFPENLKQHILNTLALKMSFSPINQVYLICRLPCYSPAVSRCKKTVLSTPSLFQPSTVMSLRSEVGLNQTESHLYFYDYFIWFTFCTFFCEVNLRQCAFLCVGDVCEHRQLKRAWSGALCSRVNLRQPPEGAIILSFMCYVPLAHNRNWGKIYLKKCSAVFFLLDKWCKSEHFVLTETVWHNRLFIHFTVPPTNQQTVPLCPLQAE